MTRKEQLSREVDRMLETGKTVKIDEEKVRKMLAKKAKG